MGIELRLEEEKDHRIVEELTREAFWNVYKPGCDEHFVLHHLRSLPCFVRELDFVAELNGMIVGNIVYSKGTVLSDVGREQEVLSFGPVGVLPAYQGQGIGSRLIKHTMELAKHLDYKAVVIFGNSAYYQRFGFEAAQKFAISTAQGKNFDAFMAKELVADSLQGISGRLYLDEVFFNIDQEQLERYDSAFPTREKKVTITQLKGD